jgi:hypothetical protein
MTIHYLTDTWPWFDARQCYGRLVHYVKQIQPQTKEVRVRYGLADKMAGRLYSIVCGHPKRRDSVFAAAELRFSRSFLKRMKPDDIYHILFLTTIISYLSAGTGPRAMSSARSIFRLTGSIRY